VWRGLQQSLIDDAVDQWPTSLRAYHRADGGHFKHLVTVNLFSLYLMNFMFHATLDAVGNVLRVHYKSMKCDVSFSQGQVHYLTEVNMFFHVCVKMFYLLTAMQNLLTRAQQ